MATYWVSASTGDDADDGSTYALAKLTIAAGIALCTAKGDILNVVNDADHAWPTTETDIPAGTKGTSFSDIGTLIRGTDTLGAAALTSVVAGGGDSIHRVLRVVADTGYVIVRNLEFDATAKTADANAYTVARMRDTGSPDPGPIRFEGCSFLGASTGAVPTGGTRQIFDIHSTAPPAGNELCQLVDCYIQNYDNTLMDAGASLDKTIDGCVIFVDAAVGGPNIHAQTLGAGAGGEMIFTGNTVYWSLTAALPGIPLSYSVVDALDAGIVTVQNNLIYIETTHASPDARFLVDAVDGATSSMTDTIDYNMFIGGPNVASGDVHTDGWYSGLFAVSPVNDQEMFEVAEATIFSTPASTYAWDALGNGVEITILKDLRPILFTSASSTGGVVGALDAGQTDYQLSSTINTEVPDTGDTVQIVLTAGNSVSGTNSSALEISAVIPAGLTYSSHVAAQGTYVSATGVWTVGALAAGASTTLTLNIVVDSDQGGQTIVWTGSVTSGTPDPGSPTGDDITTETMVVVDDTTVLDPDNPAAAPFIDTLPLIAPDLSLEMLVKLEMIQSRQREVYEREDFEDKHWSEFTSKRLVLTTNTTEELNLGGIGRGEYLVLDSTSAVDVSVVRGGTQRYWTNVKTLVIARGDFERVHIRNTSLTVSATILVGVVD